MENPIKYEYLTRTKLKRGVMVLEMQRNLRMKRDSLAVHGAHNEIGCAWFLPCEH